VPRLKNYGPGKRVNVWLPEKHLKIARDLDNLSNFFQLSLEQAAGIMALDIIKQEKGLKQELPTQEEIDRWNKDHPQNPLTQKRDKECNTPNSASKPELW
jgi:hypothetical protein